VFVGLAVPLIMGAAVVGLSLRTVWVWLFGLALGVLMTVYLVLRDSPPAYIEHWRTGYQGERRTARVLAPLRRGGYVLFHDLPDRRTGDLSRKGNVDHVVVCSGGVFLLDSKLLGGEASIQGDTVHVQMRDDDEDSYDIRWLATGMRNRARRLQEDIQQKADIADVAAVVVFWNVFEDRLVTRDGVVFVHGEQLVGWLREQGAGLTPDRVSHVAACIEDARPPEHGAWWQRPWMAGLQRAEG
jgi:hypothetical protein